MTTIRKASKLGAKKVSGSKLVKQISKAGKGKAKSSSGTKKKPREITGKLQGISSTPEANFQNPALPEAQTGIHPEVAVVGRASESQTNLSNKKPVGEIEKLTEEAIGAIYRYLKATEQGEPYSVSMVQLCQLQDGPNGTVEDQAYLLKEIKRFLAIPEIGKQFFDEFSKYLPAKLALPILDDLEEFVKKVQSEQIGAEISLFRLSTRSYDRIDTLKYIRDMHLALAKREEIMNECLRS